LRLLLAGVGGILEGAGGLLEDGVLAGVPLGEHPLLLEPGELPPVVDRREHLPHQDQRQPCSGKSTVVRKVVRNSEAQSGTVRYGQTQSGTVKDSQARSGTVRHGHAVSCTVIHSHAQSNTVRHNQARLKALSGTVKNQFGKWGKGISRQKAWPGTGKKDNREHFLH
jgi:hypothetical protein